MTGQVNIRSGLTINIGSAFVGRHKDRKTLGKVFGTTPAFWLNLQSRYDVLTAEKEIGKELNKIDPAPLNVARRIMKKRWNVLREQL